jgi:SecY interacting protein Syd
MKKKLKQPLTLFFAITDDESMILSLDNENGEVWVEKVGCEAHKKVANSLIDFIQSLTPRIP